MPQNHLAQYLDHSAQIRPEHTAVEEADGGAIQYGALADLSDRLRDRLIYAGIGRGDRVGVYLRKSIDSVAAIFGILKSGAAYVPVDPNAPPARNAYIFSNCAVKAAIVENQFADGLLAELDPNFPGPEMIVTDGVGEGLALKAHLEKLQAQDPAPVAPTPEIHQDDLAYILYTSGSTGKPKGVMLTHRAALSFVDWCSEAFSPGPDARFSSHAPFHFDLSILDIYVPLKHQATLILIGENLGKDPNRLAALISDKEITNWYSTPSILSLLTQYGKLDRFSFTSLKMVLFAGEVFPIKHLRALKNIIPHPRYFNLYGPTETNVCTYLEIPSLIEPERSQPYPIGEACSHYSIRVVDEHGQDVEPGQEGELIATSPGVMEGYWNLPERTADAFIPEGDGSRWYKTGDIVIEREAGIYDYLGRRDRMVKRRGYRVELGEIEMSLYRHPAIAEAAVVALDDEESGVKIKAHISCKGETRPSLIEMKRFCAENLPIYMVPDLFSFYDSLPKTSTDKINYQELMAM